jgi:hypothetical protein
MSGANVKDILRTANDIKEGLKDYTEIGTSFAEILSLSGIYRSALFINK